MIFHACGGGTGSGLGCSTLERSSVGHGKKSKPSSTTRASLQVAGGAVEPHSTVLCAHSMLEHTVVTFMMDNGTLHHPCRRNLDTEGSMAWAPVATTMASPLWLDYCGLYYADYTRLSSTSYHADVLLFRKLFIMPKPFINRTPIVSPRAI